MSEHVEKLRCVGEPCSTDEMAAEAAADHMERCEAALRASTELLDGLIKDTSNRLKNGPGELQVERQIAANEAVLGGGK